MRSTWRRDADGLQKQFACQMAPRGESNGSGTGTERIRVNCTARGLALMQTDVRTLAGDSPLA